MPTSRRTKSSITDYERPPIVEAVYGVKFAPLKGWMLPHVGAYWQLVVDEFPRCEHAQPINDADIIDPSTGIPLTRIWLINDDDDQLIQLQPGRFLFNWRYRDGVRQYPRYEALSQKFFALFQQFLGFVTEHGLGDMELFEYELTYINHIVEHEGWKFPEQLGRVMNQLEWQDEHCQFLPRPTAMSWQAQIPFQDESGTLSVKLASAERIKDHRQILVLELSARGLSDVAPLDHVGDWFSHAHEWIVRGFEDLTSEEAQRELWGKHE